MGSSHNTCIFCDIINKKAPAEVIFEDEDVISVLDVHPIHYGHTLVIPKHHSRDFLDLPERFFPPMMHAARVVARALVEEYHLEGYNIFSNNGEVAGQTVFHFHLHITPRHADDNIRFVLNLKRYAGNDLGEAGLRLRQRVHHLLHR